MTFGWRRREKRYPNKWAAAKRISSRMMTDPISSLDMRGNSQSSL